MFPKARGCGTELQNALTNQLMDEQSQERTKGQNQSKIITRKLSSGVVSVSKYDAFTQEIQNFLCFVLT